MGVTCIWTYEALERKKGEDSIQDEWDKLNEIKQLVSRILEVGLALCCIATILCFILILSWCSTTMHTRKTKGERLKPNNNHETQRETPQVEGKATGKQLDSAAGSQLTPMLLGKSQVLTHSPVSLAEVPTVSQDRTPLVSTQEGCPKHLNKPKLPKKAESPRTGKTPRVSSYVQRPSPYGHRNGDKSIKRKEGLKPMEILPFMSMPQEVQLYKLLTDVGLREKDVAKTIKEIKISLQEDSLGNIY